MKIHPDAQLAFDRLQPGEKQAIFQRLQKLLEADDPYRLPFVQMLQDTKYERSRKFRVGDYRIRFVVKSEEVTELRQTYRGTLYLLDIRNRQSAYKP